jgi:hypothetical protein
MFITFIQNNPGGKFIGPRTVVIEGNSYADILDSAEDYGIYFDGVEEGTDCKCCGDRWNCPSESKMNKNMMFYGEEIDMLKTYIFFGRNLFLNSEGNRDFIIIPKNKNEK